MTPTENKTDDEREDRTSSQLLRRREQTRTPKGRPFSITFIFFSRTFEMSFPLKSRLNPTNRIIRAPGVEKSKLESFTFNGIKGAINRNELQGHSRSRKRRRNGEREKSIKCSFAGGKLASKFGYKEGRHRRFPLDPGNQITRLFAFSRSSPDASASAQFKMSNQSLFQPK